MINLLIFSYPLVLSFVLVLKGDDSFEHQQHKFWLRNKKIVFNYTFLSKGLVLERTTGLSHPFLEMGPGPMELEKIAGF